MAQEGEGGQVIDVDVDMNRGVIVVMVVVFDTGDSQPRNLLPSAPPTFLLPRDDITLHASRKAGLQCHIHVPGGQGNK
ncbi:UNVERIFIED_CONTAM: hypothetical protein FKN15_013135 [Acipenser sinensis]